MLGGIGSLWPSGISPSHASPASIGPLAQAVVGGVIGGVTVFLGVLLAEYWNRKRDRANQFDDAYWTLWVEGKALSDAFKSGQSNTAPFLAAMGRLRGAARPPLPHAKELSTEIEAMLNRYQAQLVAWDGGGAPPNIKEVIGDHLAKLARRPGKVWNV